MIRSVSASRSHSRTCVRPDDRRGPDLRSAAPPAPFRSVVAYVMPGASSFGLSVVANMFVDRTAMGLPAFDLTVCGDDLGSLRTDIGLVLQVEHRPEVMKGADLVILLPSDSRPLRLRRPTREAITAAHRRGAIVAAYDTGTFLLADTGLLAGRRATTDWSLAGQLAERHPEIDVRSESLYVDEGRLVTGAGAAAGMDMLLHLLRREHGTFVSTTVASEAMVTSRRESGQVYYVPAPAGQATQCDTDDHGDARLADVLAWAAARLEQRLSVTDLARHALMSPRTFARHFRAAMGTTPHAWLRDQRLDRAEELLETTDLPIRTVAQKVGFRSDGVLRDQFMKRHGVSPRAYRHAHHRRSPWRTGS
ncbi:GlxA family transcriptional regulator [Nonomuraea dietziae]|uniref:GlxA family transcriptional regulator n=1 Tax=Nonomuraea dietziae TaxID=65515 RepID=UPI0033C1CEE0